MPNKERISEAARLLASPGLLSHFMPTAQRAVLFQGLASEEANAIADQVLAIAEKIRTMPMTYDQDGKGDAAVAHLHYFRGGVDAWVTERDMGMSREEPIGEQLQAFGFMSLGDPQNAELGYIGIADLIDNQVELDLHWEPKTIGEIKKELGL